MTKIQMTKTIKFRILNLKFICYLGFVIWNFRALRGPRLR